MAGVEPFWLSVNQINPTAASIVIAAITDRLITAFPISPKSGNRTASS
jgi:hypothetical protein